MKSVSLLLVIGLSIATVAGACGGGSPPPENPSPVDTAAENQRMRDSIAAAQADAERAAAAERERLEQQRIADSLAALARAGDEVRAMLGTMIHFDYDRSNIRPDDMGALDQKVAIMQANPDLRIRIGGHCDERGSDEYNLALGNRRAQAAKQYLVSHGVDANRIETQSWGEERPLVDGHDESAWSQNRRSEFEAIGGGENLRRP
ncbi:MAG TPA: peptidoglycan-associated lipoprotein Pal [Gemmatimonadales bacterium]|nr:peptidoglycan-associated lipoprotein Pal [Gemmatimonadales bacterium]